MAEAKKKRVRARNEDGTLKADDKSTPDINEAWVEETPAVETPSIVIYESREKEPKMFDCAYPIFESWLCCVLGFRLHARKRSVSKCLSLRGLDIFSIF